MDPRIAAVEASPAAVAAHDRAGWLALFADDGVVEDPVGSLPCRRGPGTRDQVGPFWDAFIAPNAIRFEVHRDVAAGAAVVRDLTIHTTMATGLELAVPAFVVYELSDGGGGLRYRRLAAHWEIVPSVRAILRCGTNGLATSLRMTGSILRAQGLRGLRAYVRSILGGLTRRRGLRIAEAFEAAFNRGDPEARSRLVSGAGIEGVGALDPEARILVSKVITAGRYVAFRLALHGAGATRHGVGFLAAGRGGAIRDARFFLEA